MAQKTTPQSMELWKADTLKQSILGKLCQLSSDLHLSLSLLVVFLPKSNIQKPDFFLCVSHRNWKHHSTLLLPFCIREGHHEISNSIFPGNSYKTQGILHRRSGERSRQDRILEVRKELLTGRQNLSGSTGNLATSEAIIWRISIEILLDRLSNHVSTQPFILH